MLVQHPVTGEFVVVDEARGRGLWLPGGRVERGEAFEAAAARECMEEAGVDIELKGVIRVEWNVCYGTEARMRVIFYAHPKDHTKPLKSVADKESNGAFWASIDTIAALEAAEKTRGPELLQYARYVADRGVISPLTVLSREDDVMAAPSASGGFVGVPVARGAAAGEAGGSTAVATPVAGGVAAAPGGATGGSSSGSASGSGTV